MLASLKQKYKGAKLKYQLLGLLISLLVVGALFWNLGTSTKGYSLNEVATINASIGIKDTLKNPINAPYKGLVKVVNAVQPNNRTALRMVSTLLATIFLLSIYFVLRYWFGSFTACLGAILLLSTPLFIILARVVGPGIMYFSYLLPAVIYVWLVSEKRNPSIAVVLLAVILSITIYTPGVIWLVLFSLLFVYRDIYKSTRRASNGALYLAGALVLVLLMPLAWSIGTNWHVAQALFLIPSHIPSVVDLAKNLAWAPVGLIWHTRYLSDVTVGQSAVIGVSALMFAIFGIFAMFTQARREAIYIGAIMLVGMLLAGINNSVVLLSLAIPALIVFSTAGMRYLYIEWKSVFPRNPLPNALAVCLLVIVVAQSYVYGINYVHQAWPHTLTIRNTYVLK